MSKTPADEITDRDLATLLGDASSVSPELLRDLHAAAKAADADPSFHAEHLKGMFVEELRSALEERSESQSELAKRWGRSRQYLSKIFAEDRRVNFTIDTLCELAALVGRRVQILMRREEEQCAVFRYSQPRTIADDYFTELTPQKQIQRGEEPFVEDTSPNHLNAPQFINAA